MEHPMIPAANFLPADPALNLEIYRDPQLNGVYGRGYLRISPRIMREQELLNARIQIMPGVADELAMKNSDGVLSAAMLWKSIREGKAPNDLATHIGNVISDLDQIAIYSFRRAYRGDADPVSLLYQLEQAPDRNSRIMLSESRDELGSHRVKIDWQVGDHERRTLERVNMILAEEVGKSGLGRVNILADDGETGWPPGLRGSWHQIGTTIMNDDAKSGVVNRDCRVHGTPNLFVAGSSVFPTSGTANPTLTIIALAMRLSDHLKEVLR
jgi:choline dehydrogenase-like flavoprotein